MIKVIPQYVPKDPFTVCVSSGVDSICAAHWLNYNYHKMFNIIHLNHWVQPDVNNDMEISVAKFSRDHNIGCMYECRSTYDDFNDTSENGLREWRLYVMKLYGGEFVTAHHLDDACENYLSNCFHGTPEHKPITEFTKFDKFSIYHPFLLTTKQDFIDYANANDLMKYVVEDPTNKDTKYKRNWIRNVIIPELNDREMGIQTIVRKKFYNNLIKTEI